MRLRLILLIACSFAAACVSAPKVSDNTTLVVFSRHTFRGITKTIGPHRISLPEFGIDLTVPALSYGEDATPRGLVIAQRFASEGLQKAAATAVAALGSGQTFDGRWDEIRADFSTERTFWTALRLREGLMAQGNGDIPFTGCKTEPKKGIDAVAIDDPAKQCIPDDILQPLLSASPDLEKFRTRGQDFLNTVRSGAGMEGAPARLPDPVYTDGKLPAAYTELASLASIIEMSAELGPPLESLFPKAPRGPLLRSGKAAVSGALDTLGIRFFVSAPAPMADAVGVAPVNFIASRPKGSHLIILTHDDFISMLLRSLGLIASGGNPDDLAMYPIESFVFALGDSSVSVVRMRIEVHDPDGSIPGPYTSKVLWKGTRSQWEDKVRALNQRAQAWDIGPAGNDCLKAIQVCTPEKVDASF